MLISYPIIPANAVNQSDTEKFEAALLLAQTQRGLYPVTTGNRWHGGIHLTPGDEPIRAIADGVIVAYRMAPDTKEYPGQGQYDTSFVLIRHETESGEDTRVRFYSLYMHLKPKGQLTDAQRSQLAPFLRDAANSDSAVQAPANTHIWRKEVLGFSGQLYGHPTTHFEIFATQTDLDGFWLDRAAIAAGQNGSNDVFGDMHFVIPARRQFTDRHPHAVAPHRIDLPGPNAFYGPAPANTTGAAAADRLPVGSAGQNQDRLHVIVNLSLGLRTATTYRLDANSTVIGQVGDPIVQDDYEYELFRLATALYKYCPSAGFEYLRFGRFLGPDTTIRAENWQLIRYSETEIGYINLADPTHQISVLSAADFPLYWKKLEEGETASPADGIANIDRLTQLLALPAQPGAPSLSAPADFSARAADASVANALRHFVCKHPSEWDASDLETRYAALRQPGKPLHGDATWNDFKQHVEAMAFWPQTGIAERSVWHFHPMEFIRHYQSCSWLSQKEFARCLPRRSLSDPNLTWATALARSQTHYLLYNKFIRKYCGDSRPRYLHNLAQSFIETGIFSTMNEYGSGRAHIYGPFYGRGFHQLTWAGNYEKYGTYKNIPNSGGYSDNRITATSVHPIDSGGNIMRWSPRYDPTIVANADHAGESSGFYWVSKTFRGTRNINRVADLGVNIESVAFCSWLINGGGNGYEARQQFAKYLINLLLDTPLESGSQRFNYPPLTPAGNPTLCRTFPPTSIPNTSATTVHYNAQTPP